MTKEIEVDLRATTCPVCGNTTLDLENIFEGVCYYICKHDGCNYYQKKE